MVTFKWLSSCLQMVFFSKDCLKDHWRCDASSASTLVICLSKTRLFLMAFSQYSPSLSSLYLQPFHRRGKQKDTKKKKWWRNKSCFFIPFNLNIYFWTGVSKLVPVYIFPCIFYHVEEEDSISLMIRRNNLWCWSSNRYLLDLAMNIWIF